MRNKSSKSFNTPSVRGSCPPCPQMLFRSHLGTFFSYFAITSGQNHLISSAKSKKTTIFSRKSLKKQKNNENNAKKLLPGTFLQAKTPFYHKFSSLSTIFSEILYKFLLIFSQNLYILHKRQQVYIILLWLTTRDPTSNTYFDRLPAIIGSQRLVIWLFGAGRARPHMGF